MSLPALPPERGANALILALSALAFLLGCAEVVRDNAAQTLMPAVVPPADLERANGRLWSVEQVMGAFVGPPLAGVLIAYAVPAPFALDALAFGLAAWLIWCVALPPRALPPRRSVRAEAAEGWRWMRAHPVILRLAIMLGVLNALGTMGITVLVLVSQERLGLTALGHGALLTAGAAGGVLGGALCPAIAARLGPDRSLQVALLVFPLPFLAIGLAPSPAVVAMALFAEVFAGMLWNVVTVSYRQRRIPDALLGRVNSLYRFFGWGMMPAGALLGGWVVALAEPGLGREAALGAPYLLAALGAAGLCLYGRARLRL